jgi:hypothetical protein
MKYIYSRFIIYFGPKQTSLHPQSVWTMICTFKILMFTKPNQIQLRLRVFTPSECRVNNINKRWASNLSFLENEEHSKHITKPKLS